MQLLFGWIEFHQRFGFVRIARWKFRWRKVLWWQSPLLLRYSFSRLQLVSDRPMHDFLQLLWENIWPFPHYRAIKTLPRPPLAILADADAVERHYYRYSHIQRTFPLWARRDTLPLAFFRLYEAICIADDPTIGYVTEYMFFRPEPEWALRLLPDPRTIPPPSAEETDIEVAQRLAVMARLALSLESVFNWRLELGLRRDGTVQDQEPDGTPQPWVPEVRPGWVDEIPDLPELLLMSKDRRVGDLLANGKPKYNVIIHGGALRTV